MGFTYPAFLPGAGASLVLAWIAHLVFFRYETLRWNLRTLAFTVFTLIAAILVVKPYLALTGTGTVSQMQILSKQAVVSNIIKYLVVAIPILIVILLSVRAFKQVNLKALLFLVIVIVSTMAGYVAIHLPMDNEYKLLLLSTVTLGILGGVAFGEMARRLAGYRMIGVFILLALFLFPTFRFVKLKLIQERAGRPSQAFVEKGRSIRSADGETDEFYQWIKKNTDRRSAFIDQELEIPVLAERPLFIGIGGREPGQRKGFGPVDLILRFQSGYPPDLLDMRRRIVEKIYAANQQLSEEDLDELLSLPGDLYVVLRTKVQAGNLDKAAFREVFASQAGNFRLYQLQRPRQ
jgi:hypothetical protein